LLKNIIVYVLTRESLLIEDLQCRLLLPHTNAVNKLVIQRQEKEMWYEFYATEAMMSRNWTKPNYELRHVVTQLLVYGFHHKVCQLKGEQKLLL
jgi:hypothetical protein